MSKVNAVVFYENGDTERIELEEGIIFKMEDLSREDVKALYLASSKADAAVAIAGFADELSH